MPSVSLRALLLLACGSAGAQFVPGTIHTIFSTECNRYFDWQSLGLVHSARAVGQAGPITRLMACNECASPETPVLPPASRRCPSPAPAAGRSASDTLRQPSARRSRSPLLASPNYDTGIDADTHTHPNWAVHPVTGDRYSPYNKPASIVHWYAPSGVAAARPAHSARAGWSTRSRRPSMW
jgi:peptidyl serine alpha-galactosyltransferase